MSENLKLDTKTSKELDEYYAGLYQRGDIGEFDGPYPCPMGDDGHSEAFYYGFDQPNVVAIDAETYSLRGQPFAVAISDELNNNYTFAFIEEGKASDWVIKNVFPALEECKDNIVWCQSYEDMLTRAKKILENRYFDYALLAHMASPVEYNLLREMDRVYPGEENVYDRTVVEMARMKYFLQDEDGNVYTKEVGDSVNAVIKEFNKELYGKDHNPEADNRNALKCRDLIIDNNNKEEFREQKEEILRMSPKEEEEIHNH